MEAPLKILAVDNEPSITLSLRFVFAGPRYELTCVGNGGAALARLDANSNLYDVIIVVSAYLTHEIRESFEQVGVNALFSKPFIVEELRSAVDRIAV